MKIPKGILLTKAEKQEILRKWNNETIGFGEINYVEYLVLQKVMPHLKQPFKEV